MASQFQTQKAPSTSTAAPQPSFQPRSFVVQAKADSSEETQETSLKDQLSTAERLGHSFDRLQVQASTPSATVQAKAEVPIQRDEDESEEGQMKAEGTDASLQVPSIQRDEDESEEGQMKAEGTETSLQVPSIQRDEDEAEEG